MPDVAAMLATPLLLGMDWMDPAWLLDRFGAELFWVSMVIIFIECGLFFPFLPGDTLLFALGLFIATERIDLFGASGPVVEVVVCAIDRSPEGQNPLADVGLEVRPVLTKAQLDAARG